jgi:hypothetical protein
MLGVMGQDAFAALDLGGQLVPWQGTLGRSQSPVIRGTVLKMATFSTRDGAAFD